MHIVDSGKANFDASQPQGPFSDRRTGGRAPVVVSSTRPGDRFRSQHLGNKDHFAEVAALLDETVSPSSFGEGNLLVHGGAQGARITHLPEFAQPAVVQFRVADGDGPQRG